MRSVEFILRPRNVYHFCFISFYLLAFIHYKVNPFHIKLIKYDLLRRILGLIIFFMYKISLCYNNKNKDTYI